MSFRSSQMMLASKIRFGFLTAIAVLPWLATGQTLTITNGVQTYVSLSSTTVTLSNRCELRVTSTSNPIPGSTINLDSPDAWFILTGIKPSAVASTYLGQMFVNGAAAVVDNNVRVVQYGQRGAAVIPHSTAFLPLQTFDGPNFTGASAQFSQFVYYKGTGLGAMDMNIRSFRLKRGYQAVLAQNTSGSGFSKCYVAQDGDLDVGVLPSQLDHRVRFIYITPWRWTGKKGTSGDPGISLLNLLWWYNWNISSSSSRDLEYVAIRQNQGWPPLNQNWQSLGINTLLGYNEPDHADQANMSVSAAISAWGDLLGTGLRVGSPAPSDGGRSSWLYPFIQQADAAGLRVDFVAVHYYQAHNPADASGAAAQMLSFLQDVWNNTHRPIWITEWNNGANWTDNNPWPPPTYAQQQACIAAMVNMLETTSFVERYALYNWVEDMRAVVTNGAPTPAGVTYSNQVSALSYRQAMPDSGARSVAQLLFDGNTLDTSGHGNNGLAAGSPGFTAGHSGQALVLDGANSFIQLPPNVANSNAFSFAAWVNWNGGGNWQRIFDLGSDTSHYLFLTPSSGSGTLRFAINNGSGEQIVQSTVLASGQWQHVCLTLSGGTAKLYTNGVLVASTGGFTITPASFKPLLNYLGKSQFTADPLFNGALDDVQIADYEFSPAQIAALMTNTPPQFTTNFLPRGTAPPFVAFATNITGTATDPDPGDTITYSKAVGPAWLAVSANGTLTGTPGTGDGGTNYFTVRATDTAGASAFAEVTVFVPISYGSGTWITDADGSWDDAFNWSGGLIPNGGNGANYTADFSTVMLSADHLVTVDTQRSIGTLKFGDASGGGHSWTLGGGNTLTLDTGSSTVPSVVMNSSTTIISTPVAGSNGFAKSGVGTLVLDGSNPLSGTVYIDSSSTSFNEGIVRAASPGSLAGVTGIQIRNNNSGSSVLQLDGSNGDVSSPAAVTLSGRTVNTVAIQNLSGSNTISGTTTINVGGGFYNFQSDAGQLNLGGFTSVATGGRTLTFQGNGDFQISGAIQNGSATMGLTKTGPGTLTLAGNNTYTGTTRIAAGALALANAAGLQGSTLDLNIADSGVLSFGALSNATFGALAGSRSLALTNTNGAPVFLSVGANGTSQTYSGALSGSGTLTKTGTNTFILSGANSFAGPARVIAGTLVLGASNTLGSNTLEVAESGAFSFGPFTSVALGGLAGSRNLGLTNISGIAVALSIGANGQNTAYSGTMSGPGSLTKTGPGMLALAGSNSYTGGTVISTGTVKLSRDPVFKMTFDNASGIGNGSIVSNDGTAGATLNGTIVGAGANITSSGKFGNALSINGVGGKAATNIVLIPSLGLNTDATGSWTVAYWIKTTTAGAMIMYQGNGTWSSSGQTAYLLNANSATVAGTRAGAVRWAGGFLTGTAALNDGNWHFITLVDNAGTETIYVDGNADTVTSTMTLPLSSAANQIWIGGSPDVDSGAFKMNGLIDEVAMYNRPLSLTEIRSLTNPFPALTTGSFGGQLPAGTALAIASGATFDLGGNSQTVASLADNNGGGSVTNSGPVPVTLTLSGASGSNLFSGTIADTAASNALSLVKSGNSIQVLAGPNNYRGTTTVSAGRLQVDGSLGTNVVNVNSGTLGGNGTLGGSVNVQPAGTLAPGGSIGSLTINGSLTLLGTTAIELDKSILTNDSVHVLGNVAYGGTLNVANLGGSLAPGDSFKLFYAASYSNAFSALTPPTPGLGLLWNTNMLALDGTLRVQTDALQQPSLITSVPDNSNVVFSSTNGTPYGGWSLWSSTDLTLPLSNWHLEAAGSFDSTGAFARTNLVSPGTPQLYYVIRQP